MVRYRFYQEAVVTNHNKVFPYFTNSRGILLACMALTHAPLPSCYRDVLPAQSQVVSIS